MAGLLDIFGGVDGLIGSLFTANAQNAYSMGMQNQYNKESMKDSFDYGQSGQQNAALNNVIGLRRAGLNPALASGGNFSPSATPSPQSVSPIGSSFGPLDVLQALSASKVASAQANLLGAQAQDVEISVGERLGEQYALDAAAKTFMRKEIEANSPYSSAYQQILDNQNAISGGSAKALRFWHQFVSEKDNADAQAIVNAFVNEVYRQKSSNGAAKILATLDHRDLLRFAMEYTMNNAEVSHLLASTDLTNAQIRESAAHTHQMLTDSDFKYHKDFAAMFKNGDYSAAAASLFQSAVQGAAAGAGIYFGSKGAGSIVKVGGRRVAPTTQKYFDAIYKTGFEGKKLKKKDSPLSSLSQSEQNRKILSYY